MYALYAKPSYTYIDYIAARTLVCGGTLNTDTVNADMSDTSIRVSNELADELFDRKKRGESYEDVIWRLIEKADQVDGQND